MFREYKKHKYIIIKIVLLKNFIINILVMATIVSVNVFLLNNYICLIAIAQLTSDSGNQQIQLPGIKITSHISGQQVPAGALTISGTSTDSSTAECQVYADWNDEKPYQKVEASGPGGRGDYSKWTFRYDANYHLIENGTNNLTTKISCLSVPLNVTKWNSIDVIGVTADHNATLMTINPNNENVGVESVGTIPQQIPKNVDISIDMHVERPRVRLGEMQNLIITASNAADLSQKIALASTNLTVSPSVSSDLQTGPIIEYSGVTNDAGEMSYTWKIEPRFTPGEYIVNIIVTADGYQPSSGATIFEVEEAEVSD